MVDDIWEYYAKDMMFESHKEPHYVTQQYIKHLEKERDKWRKIADRLVEQLRQNGLGPIRAERMKQMVEDYEQAVRGE